MSDGIETEALPKSAKARNWIKQEGQDAEKATFPELFFDLVFVFALIQLSHALAEDFGPTAVLEAAVLILSLWWLWIHTTWITNLLNTEVEPVRLLLFTLMFGGVLLAIALPQAFAEQGFAFALIYSALQIGRSLFALYAFRGQDRQSFLVFLRVTIWLAISSVFWIAGGLSDLTTRLVFWGCALGIEYAGPVCRYFVPGVPSSDEDRLHLSGEHLAERCALFVIICLGETILTTGRTATDYMSSGLTFVVFCSAFISTVAMWWIYFHHGQEKASRKAENADEKAKIANNLFNYGHLPIVAGIIVTAVGEDFSLSHSHDGATVREAIAILGGPILFLAGNIGVKIAAAYERPLSHVVGVVLLCLLLPLQGVPLYVLQLASTAVILLVAVWEYLALRGNTANA
ncbi:low temperature requirement protein A [Agrobacterium tumefaciens]|uniref:low temperature requirement protein A n=1 Tax=Agrobacterium tumefaciens TaxID=358 RepID=UPI00287CA1AC|nr:low temperature requirement protein A [Agrobacterium tumefaciens]MDS7594556.1 low temperature requirement protein A [Agrobacterium tumefaciens]